MSRIKQKFSELKLQGRAGLVTFTMVGDPDLETSFQLLKELPKAGADIIELGMAFTDPMADGPAIQTAGLRALKSGVNLIKTLDVVARFRETDSTTPIVLMGYFNPIFHYGVEPFMKDAKSKGVDGLIIVDVPPEEDAQCCLPAKAAGLDFVRLATPTTDQNRLPKVLENSSGFLYYVSVAGVTGQKSAQVTDIETALKRIRQYTELPIAVGFGIKTPEQVAKMAQHADAVVVGSAIVSKMADTYAQGVSQEKIVAETTQFVRDLANALSQNKQIKQMNG